MNIDLDSYLGRYNLALEMETYRFKSINVTLPKTSGCINASVELKVVFQDGACRLSDQ